MSLYTIYCNLYKCAKDYWKYILNDNKISSEEFINNITLQHYIIIDAKNHNNRTVKIILTSSESKQGTSIGEIRSLLNKFQDIDVHLVTENKNTKDLTEFVDNRIRIKTCLHSHFIMELPLATYVDKHEILSADDAKYVLNSQRIKKENMPYILITDPQCIWLAPSVGDIIKITSKALPPAIRYRVVVSNIDNHDNVVYQNDGSDDDSDEEPETNTVIHNDDEYSDFDDDDDDEDEDEDDENEEKKELA